MLLILILAADVNISLAELGSTCCLKEVYDQRFLYNMDHVKDPLRFIILPPKNDNYFATSHTCIYSCTCSCIHLCTHWGFCPSLPLWNTPWVFPNACRAQPPDT